MVSYSSGMKLFQNARRKNKNKLYISKIIWLVIQLLSISCVFSLFFTVNSDKFEDNFLIIFSITAIPSLIGLHSGMDKDKKLTDDERKLLNNKLENESNKVYEDDY